MPEEPLSYEKMLAELLGLIGQEVFVAIDMRFDRQRRPLASLYELKRGKGDDLTFEGVPIGYPPGEAILFYVGDAYFIVRKNDFKRGRREDGVLSFEAGRARFVVRWPFDLLPPNVVEESCLETVIDRGDFLCMRPEDEENCGRALAGVIDPARAARVYVLVNEFQERRNVERGFGLRPFHCLAV